MSEEKEVIHYLIDTVPHHCLNPNRSREHHWTTLSREVHALRERTRWCAYDQGVRKFDSHVDIWVSFCWSSRNRMLKDLHNGFVMTKPIIDGLTDAGLWEDDDRIRIAGIDQMVLDKSGKSFYRNGCTLVAIWGSDQPQYPPPIDELGSVSQRWLDSFPR